MANFTPERWASHPRVFPLEAVSSFGEADQAYPFATNFKRFALRNLNKTFAPGDPLPWEKR